MGSNYAELGEGIRARVGRLEVAIRGVCELCKDTTEAVAYAVDRGRSISDGIRALRVLARKLEGIGEHGQARALREVANDLAGSLQYAVKHGRNQAGTRGDLGTGGNGSTGAGGFAWIGPRAG